MNTKLNFSDWKQEYPDYWINQKSNWLVREISREDEEQWVIIDDRGMMISCEWKENKEDCMEEADRICFGEMIV